MSTQLVAIKCAQCTCDFGITPEFLQRRKADHRLFRCPNGCQNVFPEKKNVIPVEKEIERLQELTRRQAIRLTALEDQLHAALRTGDDALVTELERYEESSDGGTYTE